jgi:uncharacterized protein (UPF0248 family)
MKNPLKELLNRLKHDPVLDPTKCYIRYRDFESARGSYRVPLHLCEIESKNIRHGDAIIPFHRIIAVTCGDWTLYPFADHSTMDKLFDSIKSPGNSDDSADKSL